MGSLRLWILGIFIAAAILFIFPLNFFENGAIIKSLEKNSSEFNAGLRQGMIVNSVNSIPVNTIEDYSNAISKIFSNSSTEIKISISTDKGQFVFLASKMPSIAVGEIPKTKIKTGLDLSGGARALIKAANQSLSPSEISDLVAIMNERFNVYGLKDITIKSITDLSGENYLLIEIAGATPSDLESLVSSQGKFEGKIGNKTVFSGGKDISHVERSGQQSGIEGCYPSQAGEFCRFRFAISLTESAAKKQAEITSSIPLSSQSPEYLDKKLDLYVDGNLMDSLSISKDLKGKVTTQISIQGSGEGANRQEALKDAQKNMNKLQTILITGSLPYKLEIVKLDTISPVLGKEFAKNLLLLGLLVFLIISIILFAVYRKIKITLAVILTMFSEMIITLGIASLIKWNLDAPSLAGIIAGMGTGVNDQIVILSESESKADISLKEKMKNAFFIIIGAFFKIFAAMLPLFWAGAGMLKGFALTTLIGVAIGILITRPAFAEIIKRIKE